MPRSTPAVPDAVSIDRYVLDVLMPDLVGHDRAPAAFIVFAYLWRHAGGAPRTPVQRSLRDIAGGTGLSKRGVQGALRTLSRRRLLGITRRGITDVPTYTLRTPWRPGERLGSR